jgi:hypothetical protein
VLIALILIVIVVVILLLLRPKVVPNNGNEIPSNDNNGVIISPVELQPNELLINNRRDEPIWVEARQKSLNANDPYFLYPFHLVIGENFSFLILFFFNL